MATKDKTALTDRQAEILSFLVAFTRRSGYPPTVREICKATGLRSPRSVTQHLQALERKGVIERGREKSRAIRFLDSPARRSAAIDLGGGCGVTLPMTPAEKDVSRRPAVSPGAGGRENVCMDRRFVEGPNAFVAIVGGSGLREAGVLAGDYVVIDPDGDPGEGSLVARRAGRETIVSRHVGPPADRGEGAAARENAQGVACGRDGREGPGGGAAGTAPLLGRIVAVVRRVERQP